MTNRPRRRSRRREYLLRAAAFEGYVPLVRELGLDPAALLAHAGIDLKMIAEPDTMVSYRAFLRALDAASVESGLGHFGLLLADRQHLPMLGPLGFAMAEAPDVRSALQALIEYLHLHVQGAGARLLVEGSVAIWSYAIYWTDVPGIPQQEDLATALGVNILRRLAGPGWTPDYVTLAHRAPRNAAPYRRHFRCPVRFEAEVNQIVFEPALLDRKLSSADGRLHAILNRHLRGLDASGRQDFGNEVQQLILQAMQSGNCSLQQVAHYLALTPRTLQRRLAAEGTNFQSELDLMRNRVALRYLDESAMPLTNLASMLGYADLAAFSRAFRRLNGVAPRAWRARQPSSGRATRRASHVRA